MGRSLSHLPKGTIIVGGWSSSCNNCGKDVLPDSKTHDKIAGYGGGDPGCGVEFTHITNEYHGHSKIAGDMRSDLELIPDMGWEYNPATQKMDVVYDHTAA